MRSANTIAKAQTRPKTSWIGRLLRVLDLVTKTLLSVGLAKTSRSAEPRNISQYCATWIFRTVVTLLIAFSPILAVYTRAQAATNSTINFQARILQSSGALVADGDYNVEFKIYDSSNAGASGQGVCSLDSSTDDCWWRETRTGGNAVRVVNGYVSVNLGSVTPFGANVPWDQELYITMRVGGIGAPVWDSEMVNPVTGRMKFNASPYAKVAGQLKTTNGANSTIVDFATPTGTNTITFGDGSGLVCLNNGNCNGTAGGYLLFGSGSVQNGSTATSLIRANQQGAGGLLDLQTGGVSKFGIGNDGLTTIASGVQIGNTSSAVAGTLRWTGTDFEGYDGAQWVSLTQGGGITGSVGRTIVKNNPETENSTTNPTAAMQNDDELFLNIGANETWSFRFVVTANSPAAADIKFDVTAPGGATCNVNVINAEDTVTVGNLGCGVSSGIMNVVGGVDDVYEIVGTVVNGGTPGNITLRWAQNAPTAGNTIVRAGSYMFATANGTATTTYEQGGNAFGATAVLGTTDNNGLNIITNGVTRLSFSATGEASFTNDVTLTSGVLDLTAGGITNAGSITGVGTNITATNGLTIASGGGGNLTLDSASGTLVLLDNTIQRQSTSLTFDIYDATQNTDFVITNTGVGYEANLSVEGAVTATSFSGSGSGLTAIDAGNISSGTLNDARLSANVALLNVDQIFNSRPTFDDGLTLGTTTSAVAGTLRWTGTDFEGYDGVQWVSLTSGGPGGPVSSSPALTTVIKTANEVQNSTVNAGATLQNDDQLGFAIGANEKWAFRFVVQANSPNGTDLKFAVTAPGGATCSVSIIDAESAIGASNLGCGVSTGLIAGNGTDDIYEVVGSVTNGATPGNITLQWAQNTANIANTTVYAGSFVSGQLNGGGLQFMQGGNDFGSTAIIGTTATNDFNFITNNTTRLSLTSAGQAVFSAELLINSGVVIGDAAGDGLTITSNTVSLPNGLNFDSNTFVIDSATNRVGIGDASPDNPLSINSATTPDSVAQVSISTGSLTNKGLVVQGVASQSANLLEVQDSNGTSLAGFNSSGQLVLGVATSSNGRIVFNNNTNANTITLVAGVATAPRNITLPDADGTICLSASSSCGFVQFALGTIQTDATTNDAIAINKTGVTGNLITMQKNGSNVLVVGNNGALQIRATSTTGLDIQNGSGVSAFTVDTSGNIVRVGTSDSTGTLFVFDTLTGSSSDPSIGSETNAQYYNSTLGKLRCYENGVWKDCLGMVVRSFVDTTSDAVVDANTTNYWDTAGENNNSTPNITLASNSGRAVMGTVTMEATASNNNDSEVSARVERGIGSAPTCGSGTAVGGRPGIFTTNNGGVQSSTVTFIDTPNTTSTVYYVLCSDTATAGVNATISRIRITLQEAVNNN